jgi:hypothetical protein
MEASSMYAQGTSVLDRPASITVAISPVIGAPQWFEPGGYVVRVERPMSYAEMVAALYDSAWLVADDLATPGDVWGQVASEVVSRGTASIQAAAAAIERAERAGAVDSPGWLAICRDRVASLVATP